MSERGYRGVKQGGNFFPPLSTVVLWHFSSWYLFMRQVINSCLHLWYLCRGHFNLSLLNSSWMHPIFVASHTNDLPIPLNICICPTQASPQDSLFSRCTTVVTSISRVFSVLFLSFHSQFVWWRCFCSLPSNRSNELILHKTVRTVSPGQPALTFLSCCHSAIGLMLLRQKLDSSNTPYLKCLGQQVFGIRFNCEILEQLRILNKLS